MVQNKLKLYKMVQNCHFLPVKHVSSPSKWRAWRVLAKALALIIHYHGVTTPAVSLFFVQVRRQGAVSNSWWASPRRMQWFDESGLGRGASIRSLSNSRPLGLNSCGTRKNAYGAWAQQKWLLYSTAEWQKLFSFNSATVWSGSSTYSKGYIDRSIFFKRLIWKMDKLSLSFMVF